MSQMERLLEEFVCELLDHIDHYPGATADYLLAKCPQMSRGQLYAMLSAATRAGVILSCRGRFYGQPGNDYIN